MNGGKTCELEGVGFSYAPIVYIKTPDGWRNMADKNQPWEFIDGKWVRTEHQRDEMDWSEKP